MRKLRNEGHLSSLNLSFYSFLLWWKVYKLRQRGVAAAKASLAQLEEQEGSYAKDQYAQESVEPAQGTAS